MYDRFILNTMIKGWFVENNNEGGRRENSYNESRGGIASALEVDRGLGCIRTCSRSRCPSRDRR